MSVLAHRDNRYPKLLGDLLVRQVPAEEASHGLRINPLTSAIDPSFTPAIGGHRAHREVELAGYGLVGQSLTHHPADGRAHQAFDRWVPAHRPGTQAQLTGPPPDRGPGNSKLIGDLVHGERAAPEFA